MDAITAKVAPGVQAVVVRIDHAGQTVTGIVTREWLVARSKVGPTQEDLLEAFEAHREYVCEAVLRAARAKRSQIVVLA